MICQVHWRRFKFQISRLKFEVPSFTVLDPCWQNRQNKLFKKCPRPFFTILSYIFFFPRKGRNARRAPWGRVSDSRCWNGEFFYITVSKKQLEMKPSSWSRSSCRRCNSLQVLSSSSMSHHFPLKCFWPVEICAISAGLFSMKCSKLSFRGGVGPVQEPIYLKQKC